MAKTTLASINLRRFLVAVLIVLLFSALTAAFYFSPIATGVDWRESFRAGVLQVLSGKSPYYPETGFVHPPWALIPLFPLALLPERLGSSINSVLTITVLFLVAYKLGARPVALFLFVSTPQLIFSAMNSNIDWLVGLGLLMPPWLGMPFVLIKPQVGAAIAIYWIIEAWRNDGWKAAVKISALTICLALLSVLMFGRNLMGYKILLTYRRVWDFNIFPWGLPIGFALMYWALKKRIQGFALLAGPFITSYIGFYSLPVSILGALPDNRLFLMLVAALWLLRIIKGMPHIP